MRRKGKLKIEGARKRTNVNSERIECAFEVRKTKMASRLAGTRFRPKDKEQQKRIERYEKNI